MKTSIFISFFIVFSFTLPAQDAIFDGKVGIGTTQVGKLLEVQGNLVTKTLDSGGIAGAFTSEQDFGVVSFWTNNNYNPLNPGSGWKRTMNLKNGNVGIGIINPDYLLHVEGGDQRAIYGSSNSDIGVYGSSIDLIGVFGKSGFLGVYGESSSSNGEGVRGEALGLDGIGVYGRAVVGTGVLGSGDPCDFDAIGPGTNYCSASSIRWKSNIVNLPNPLEKLSKLRGVSFTWDEEHGGHDDIGFIAEEVGKVFPSIVVYENNGVDASSMDYSMMTPLLIEAAKAMRQEYQDRFEEQKSEIAALKQELAEIKALLKVQVSNTDEE